MDTVPLQLKQARSTAQPFGLAAALRSCAPLPPSALFLGLAQDGLPVLFNLRDPNPSSVLVIGDPGSGKTRLLQWIARAVGQTHDPDRVRYAIISENASEWDAFVQSPNCDAVLSFHRPLTAGYLAALTAGAPRADVPSSSLLLLIDGFHALAGDGDNRAAISRWLVAGPKYGIWPFVTFSTSAASIPASWLDPFRLRLFGHIDDERTLHGLAQSADGTFKRLRAGSQFATREGATWLPFWLPEFD